MQIREEAILLKLKHVIKLQTDILNEFKKLNPVDDKEEREAKLKKLRELKREEDRIRALSDDELFDDIYEDYDWMKISAQCFDSAISPESCRYQKANVSILIVAGPFETNAQPLVKRMCTR